MNLPKFTAELALSKSTRIYRGTPRFGSFSQSAEPSISVQPSQMDAEGLGVAEEAGLMGSEEGDEDAGAAGLEATGTDDADDAGDAGDEDESAGEDAGEDAEAM